LVHADVFYRLASGRYRHCLHPCAAGQEMNESQSGISS
jgi:hypothetical protein